MLVLQRFVRDLSDKKNALMSLLNKVSMIATGTIEYQGLGLRHYSKAMKAAIQRHWEFGIFINGFC
jgi:hypothetical protein